MIIISILRLGQVRLIIVKPVNPLSVNNKQPESLSDWSRDNLEMIDCKTWLVVALLLH